MMGAFLGPWGALLGLFPGMLCGVLSGVVYTRIMKSPHFPFGPALAMGGYITLLWPGAVGAGLTWLQDLGRNANPVALVAFQIAALAVAVWLMLRVRKRSEDREDERD